jgi:hypothetical protein
LTKGENLEIFQEERSFPGRTFSFFVGKDRVMVLDTQGRKD